MTKQLSILYNLGVLFNLCVMQNHSIFKNCIIITVLLINLLFFKMKTYQMTSDTMCSTQTHGALILLT